MSKNKEIAKYMWDKGLGYEMTSAGNVFGAVATSGPGVVVMAQTYHEQASGTGIQHFCGYYGSEAEGLQVRANILNAKPRKRFVQCVIVAEVK